MNEQQEYIYSLVSNMMRFSSIMKEHISKDELCGDHVVISTHLVDDIIDKMKSNVMDICKKELSRKGIDRYTKAEKPLIDAILLMNNQEYGRKINEPETSNGT